MNNPIPATFGFSSDEISVKNCRYGPAYPITSAPLKLTPNDKYGYVPLGLKDLRLIDETLSSCYWALVNIN